MLHAVEIRFAGEHFQDVILQVRGWLDEKKLQPTAFDIGFTSPSRSCGSILKLTPRESVCTGVWRCRFSLV